MNHRHIFPVMIFIAISMLSAGCFHMRPDEIPPEVGLAAYDAYQPRHPEFTYRNVLGLQHGMTPDEVEELFGTPDRTLFKTLGNAPLETWKGIVYEYHMGWHPKGRYRVNQNTLVFRAESSPPRLVHWEIQLAYPEHPRSGLSAIPLFGR